MLIYTYGVLIDMRVKILHDDSWSELERQINEFIVDKKVIDIKFHPTFTLAAVLYY